MFPVGFAVILMMDLKRRYPYIWDPIIIHFLILNYFQLVLSCSWRNIQNIRIGGIEIHRTFFLNQSKKRITYCGFHVIIT